MNKSIKFSIIAGILIVALSVAYYFVIFLPQQNKDSRVFAANQKCREAGEKLYREDLEDAEKRGERSRLLGNNVSSVVVPPMYGYSKKLNTCLYASGSYSDWTKDGIRHFLYNEFVRDSYSEETIIRTLTYSGEQGERKQEWLSPNEFKKQKEELFK